MPVAPKIELNRRADCTEFSLNGEVKGQIHNPAGPPRRDRAGDGPVQVLFEGSESDWRFPDDEAATGFVRTTLERWHQAEHGTTVEEEGSDAAEPTLAAERRAAADATLRDLSWLGI